ncbi:MAG: DUF2970 domain-containing protein [Pseudomonadota bacterium]|nr:DUF2970 domain-containing protein [Pseudomonadota bacterium]
MSAPHHPADAPPSPERPASFWRSVRMVAWGFLGVRRKSDYQQDLAQVNPFHVIVAGLLGALALVLLLLGIVHWVAGSG